MGRRANRAIFISSVLVIGTVAASVAAMKCDIRSACSRGFVNSGGNTYFYDDNGNEVSGIYDNGGAKYYFDRENHTLTCGLVEVDGASYYFDPVSGVMEVGFVTEPSGNSMYFDPESGQMQYGWLEIEGLKYHSDESSGVLTKGWTEIDGNKYYFDPVGAQMMVGWFEADGNKYHSYGNGHITYGGLRKIDKTYYYFADDGALMTGWVDYNGTKLYFMPDTGMQAEGLVEIGADTYFFSEGQKLTDTYYIQDNMLYWLGEDGCVYRTVDGNLPMVALTYDDGPSQYTDTIVSLLEEYDAVATFFVVGNRVSWYPDALKHAADIGCEMGNHTYDHSYLDVMSASAVASTLGQTDSELLTYVGVASSVLRPPGGRVDDSLKYETDLPLILWSVDTRDWETKDAQTTINNVLNDVQDGSIVLMHDIYESTMIASETIIPELQNIGYQLVTVQEMGLLRRGGLKPGTAYYSIKPET